LGRILEGEKANYSRELEQLKAKYAQELEAYRDALQRSKTVLQAEIDRSVFVTRAHFETEFEAYKQVFGALAEVRLTMAAVRPMMSMHPANESDEDRRKALGKRVGDLMDAYNRAITVVENQAPFYPKELYSALQQCLKAASLEILDVQTSGSDTFSIRWYERGDKRMGEFMAAYTSVSDLMRLRISTLQVLPAG
jgi:hypothetical protein